MVRQVSVLMYNEVDRYPSGFPAGEVLPAGADFGQRITRIARASGLYFRTGNVSFLLLTIVISVGPAFAASPLLQGGVEERVQQPSRRAQPHVLCSAFLAAVPPGGRLHVFPKTAGGKVPLPQGGPLEERCDPPGSSALRLVGEDRNYCCFVQSADDTPGPVIDVVDDLPPEIGVHDDPPRMPPGVPPAGQPPAGSPGPDGGYWAGVQAGFRNCGESVQVMIQALQAMAVGDFKRAAQLLGATDSGAGLRSLWQEMAETPVIDMGGRRLTQFEIGERQARRLCLYVLLPKASSCAVKGTACTVRTAQTQCSVWFRRIAELQPVRLPMRLPAPPNAIVRGMLLVDENYLKQLAASEQLIFIVRDSNRWSMRWIGREGYGPKPSTVKGKTLKPEDLQGAPAADVHRYSGLSSARGMDAFERQELRKAGYSIAPEAEYEIIRGPGGANGFYSDIDLHGVYKVGGKQGWSASLKAKLDCHFFERGVQHDPHDVWPDRNDVVKAKSNYGPQVDPANGKAVTAYLPDGTALHITTLEQMRGFYQAIGVDWKAVYPNH